MEALLVDRGTATDTIFTLMGASRIKIEGSADRLVLTPASADAPSRKPTIDEIFDGYLFPMKNFKFDRNEANNYGTLKILNPFF